MEASHRNCERVLGIMWWSLIINNLILKISRIIEQSSYRPN